MKQLLCAVALAGLAAPVYAEEQHDLCAFSGACRTASTAELDELRGGFEVDTGRGRLRVDIGITREVHINGNLVARSELSLPDLGQMMMNARQGRANAPTITTTVGGHGNNPGAPLRVNGAPVTSTPVTLNESGLIVQNGHGNFAPTLSQIGGVAIPTIVQNTLDNQTISTLTHVNARLNSMALWNSMRLGDAMNSATARSGR
jgi:hypothetical protein